MGGLRVFAAVVLGMPLPISVAAAQPLLSDSEQISIDAEQVTYDQKTNTVVARGKVLITRGTTELRADEVRVNRASNHADAIGHVSVTDPEGTVLADAMHLNLDEETG